MGRAAAFPKAVNPRRQIIFHLREAPRFVVFVVAQGIRQKRIGIGKNARVGRRFCGPIQGFERQILQRQHPALNVNAAQQTLLAAVTLAVGCAFKVARLRAVAAPSITLAREQLIARCGDES